LEIHLDGLIQLEETTDFFTKYVIGALVYFGGNAEGGVTSDFAHVPVVHSLMLTILARSSIVFLHLLISIKPSSKYFLGGV